MRKSLSKRSLFVALAASLIFAPSSLWGAEDVDLLAEFNESRDRITFAAMSVLGGWSVLNLGVGSGVGFTAEDPQTRAFYQMNAGWNVVNAALAVPSLIGARRRLADPPELTVAASIRAQNQIEDLLLFNAGIDLAYITAGFYMIERARRAEADSAQLRGWGQALIVQGGFLFAFDLVTYFIQRGNWKRIEDSLILRP
ncbi:MAG: DUF6992 family protein [Spirochaetales bacterium]